MLIWVTALHCEAKPVIDYYRLEKSRDESPFDSYRGKDMVCVVSGIGKTASAAACAWSAATHAQQSPLAWINLGIAGAAEQEIGTAYQLDRITDAESGEIYYPTLSPGLTLPRIACMTLNRPGGGDHADYLFDMEASGFMNAALRFSHAELIGCMKIVSDNRWRQIGRDRQAVSTLIHRHIDSIDRLATCLLGRRSDQATGSATADVRQDVDEGRFENLQR